MSWKSGTFNGLTFGSGTAYGIAEIDGWYSMPDARTDDVPRQGAHGAHGSYGYLGERVVTLMLRVGGTGSTLAAQRTDFETTIEALAAAFQLTDEFLAFTLGDQRIYARVTKRDIPLAAIMSGRRAEVAIELTAKDPRRYSNTENSQTFAPAASHSITNAGKFETPLLLTIDGPTTGPAFTNGSQVLDFDGLTLTAGQSAVIDTGLRTILKVGADAHGVLHPNSVWFNLPPGAHSFTFNVDTSSSPCQLVAKWRDAWV